MKKYENQLLKSSAKRNFFYTNVIENKRFRSRFSTSCTKKIFQNAQQARKSKTSRQKNLWYQVNLFFLMKIAYFVSFPSSKIDFWPFWIEFGQKKYSWNWFIWFHEFFFSLDLSKFSGPLCINICEDSNIASASPLHCALKMQK